MNISKKLVLFFVATTVVAAHAVGDLGDYLSGRKVDKRKRTILHVLAKNSDNDDFELKIKVFDFAENKLPGEIGVAVREYQNFEFLYSVSPEMALMIGAKRLQEFVNQKDEDGETALSYAKKVQEKRNAEGLNPHPRTQNFISFLEAFEPREDDSDDRTIFLDKGEDGGNDALSEEMQK